MPILHLSQLIGVAAGLEASELKFKRHVVSVQPVVDKLRLTGPQGFPVSAVSVSRSATSGAVAQGGAAPVLSA